MHSWNQSAEPSLLFSINKLKFFDRLAVWPHFNAQCRPGQAFFFVSPLFDCNYVWAYCFMEYRVSNYVCKWPNGFFELHQWMEINWANQLHVFRLPTWSIKFPISFTMYWQAVSLLVVPWSYCDFKLSGCAIHVKILHHHCPVKYTQKMNVQLRPPLTVDAEAVKINMYNVIVKASLSNDVLQRGGKLHFLCWTLSHLTDMWFCGPVAIYLSDRFLLFHYLPHIPGQLQPSVTTSAILPTFTYTWTNCQS